MCSFEDVALAPEPAASPPRLDEEVLALAERLNASANGGQEIALGFEAVEALFAALCAVYGQDAERQGRITPLRPTAASNPTNVLMATTALLRGANLELFELGMWQSWSGMK